ncbi:hypothetical protein V1525DRAFT_132674 [Lipomyces kononenkoae]|uniref:Uncharacterized protein n=1 Tax=Lipomyces kononenkoae TaxID=34357 RepID=A0ACC3T264_LIPKO
MLFKSKLIALLYYAVLTHCIRVVVRTHASLSNSSVDNVPVRQEYNMIRAPKHDYVAEMNLVSDVILCTVGLLEFLIRTNILKPCWLGCGGNEQHPSNPTNLMRRYSRWAPPSYSAVLSNMSFSVHSPQEVLSVLKDPLVQTLIASNPVPSVSGVMDKSWIEPYIKIENTNFTLYFPNYTGVDGTLSVSHENDETYWPLEIVDITPLLQLLEYILRDTNGVCTYLRAMEGGHLATHLRIPDSLYGKAEEVHSKLHVIQRQSRRIILLDDAMFSVGTLIYTARYLIESLTICFAKDI